MQEKLQDSLNSCNKFDDKNDFKVYVMEDCDPIDRNEAEEVSKDESFVETVRDIQNDIINEFVVFSFAYMQ